MKEDLKNRYFEASDLKHVGKDAYRFVNAVSDFATHAKPLRERDRKQIDQEIKLYMKDNEMAVSDRYRVTWANVETGRLDAKRIKAERPDIYRDFLNISSSRRFTVKAA